MMYDVIGSMVAMATGERNDIDLTELSRLADGLRARGIPYVWRSCFDGAQVVCDDWDAICHTGSYGGRHGLLEIMGSIVRNDDDEVEGYLTAEEILARL